MAYLFNELNKKDYYKRTEVKSAFDGSYILYGSKRNKDNELDCMLLSCHVRVFRVNSHSIVA